MLCVCVFRIVVYGDDMLRAVKPKSAKPFNFQQEYRLTDQQVCFGFWVFLVKYLPSPNQLFAFQALKVSDHYPVEVELK